MPAAHRAHADWSPGRLMNRAASVGPTTGELVKRLLMEKQHPEQGYRSCLGLMRLARTAGRDRLEDPESVALIRAKWDDRVGDARQEIVLIGMDMDEAILRARLDACLLTDEEMAQGPAAWTSWTNPFPGWPDEPGSP